MKKISFAIIAATFASAALAQSEEQQVDALFANWNKPDTPGAVVEVIRDGKVLLRKGYGMADLEHGTPISPATVFNIASTSKQFTAFAVHLLAQEGKLSLDDDVRKHLPELPDFGHSITIRHLLQHTSGMRDYLNLMLLAGWRLDDSITEGDVLGIIKSQRSLNFAPGQEYLYSNTGYTLAALIVQRVSGKPLPVFAKERIFDPLGMKHTSIPGEYGTIVPGRAMAYVRAADGGYKHVANSVSITGPTGVLTTVDDLALWDRNFYEGRVGGKDLITKMQMPGVLNSGKATHYASGLFVETYRGQKLVEHSGFLPGLQSQMSRFPDQHFTVTVLVNAGDINPTVMARQITDIYLDKELGSKPASVHNAAIPTEAVIDPARLDALVGYYALAPNFGLTFSKENGRLMGQGTGQPKFPLTPASELVYFFEAGGIRLTFDPPAADGKAPRVVLLQGGKELPGMRTEKTRLSAAAFKEFEGEFYSEELHVLYSIAQTNEQLMLTYPRGTVQLIALGDGKFAATGLGEIQFNCAERIGCKGFAADNGRARNVTFVRLAKSS